MAPKRYNNKELDLSCLANSIVLRESVRDDAGRSVLGEREILLFTGFYK